MKWIEEVFKHGEAYLVGGPVRDELLGIPSNDLDILVAGVPAKRLQEILEQFGSVHLVGKSFGVFKFKENGSEELIDIALPRKESSTGVGHRDFDVQADENIPIEEDLRRRDFTINSMAKNLKTHEVIDPWGGRQDLGKKIIRQVFDNTFEEDPLRMLRACQFSARLEFEVEEKTFNGMKKNSSLAHTISPERIFGELVKLLSSPKPSIGFKLMEKTGLLKEIIPELQDTVGVLQPEKYHRWPVFEHTLAVIDAADPDNLPVRWAALCHDLGKPGSQGKHPKDGRITFWGHEKISQKLTDKLLRRLKAPEALIAQVTALSKEHMFAPESELSDKALRRLIHRVGPQYIENLILLRRADRIGNGKNQDLEEWQRLLTRVRSELSEGPFDRKGLAINGAELMKELNLPPGPQIGSILDKLLEVTLDDPQNNQRNTLLEHARILINSK